MVYAADLIRLFGNLKALQGTADGQTEIDTHAPVAVADYIQGTETDGFRLSKRYRPEDAEAHLALRAESAESPSAIEDGDGLTIEQGVRMAGSDPQILARHEWTLSGDDAGGPRAGYLDLSAISPTTEGPDLTITPTGQVGIQNPAPDADVALHVNGEINVSGEYQKDGVPVSDWTEVPGDPNAATWDGGGEPGGDALVSGAWRTAYHVLEAVAAKTTANISLVDAQTIDGVSIVGGDRVAVTEQTDPAENGIFECVHPGAWVRATDADTWEGCVGAAVLVSGGTAHAGEHWAARILPGGSIGIDDMPWGLDDHAAFGVPVDVVSETECPGLNTDKLNGSPWIVPKRKILADTAYTGSDTQIGARAAITAGFWRVRAALAISPDFADDGKDLVCKIKNQAGSTLYTLPSVSVKGWTDGIFDNTATESVYLSVPYEASGDDEVYVTVSCPTGTGGAATGALIASFAGVN